jgi:translocation and assembly module TamA
MQTPPRIGILIGLALGSAALCAEPAVAFSLFGIHLWGANTSDDTFDVIDPLPYTVRFNVTGGEEGLESQLENASSLWSDRETPASGNGGLLSKARGDYRRLLVALYAAGYYGPEISIRAGGQEVSDVQIGVEFPQNVPVVVTVAPGPQFLFGATRIVNAPTPDPDPRADTPDSVGFVTGKTARSGVINRASAISVERWRHLTYAKAAETGRDVIADHPSSRLDVTLKLDPGRSAHYGPTKVVGSQRVDPQFIAFMADLPRGQPFDPDDIDAGQARLNRLGVFNSIRFEEGDVIAPDGSLPMTVRVQDRKPRTIGFGGTLSTIDGVGVSAYWQHRNLFGRAERLRFDAGVDGLGGSLNPDDYDYNVGVTFTKPGVWTPDTDFVTSLIGQRVNYDTYKERSVTASAGLSQLFGKYLTGEAFVNASRSRYVDGFGVRHFTIFGVVGRGAYDRRDVPLDATRGYYVAAEVNPFYEAEFGNFALRGTLEGRAYKSLGEKVVLAGRAKVGSYAGTSIAQSPPDLLFFAGGGGSIRGYAYRSIGVETVATPGGEPFIAGGKGLAELSGELRYRINPSWGAVGFVDSGFVTQNADLSGNNELRTGVGLGVRYFTSIGVIRADLAAPVNPRPDDSAVALYIGIGQAF